MLVTRTMLLRGSVGSGSMGAIIAESAPMNDDSQLFVPRSFIDLFVPEGRLKPTASRAHIEQRYELCEDLAQALSEQARTRALEDGVTPGDVLARMHRALQGEGSTLGEQEAQWVVTRAAELLA